jgi:hypothetical protein
MHSALLTSTIDLQDEWCKRPSGEIIMQATEGVTVRMIAFLDTFRKERDLPTTVSIQVPENGTTALDIAERLGLPLDLVEGVFLNHSGSALDARVMPGDRVAFVPYGTPASHPAFFGPFTTRR